MLANLTIKEYLEKTASNTAVPGGGSGAALSAAVAASLVEMVAKLTIGKKGYADVEAQMKKIEKRARLPIQAIRLHCIEILMHIIK